MTNDQQVPWTDAQWASVNQVIQEEANRARVAASFLSLVGPLPPDTDFVRAEAIGYDPVRPPNERLEIRDRTTIQLATLQVRVELRSAQVADPELESVRTLFRRAANVLSRLEDAVVFRGLVNVAPAGDPERFEPPRGFPRRIWEIHGGQELRGLVPPVSPPARPWITLPYPVSGQALVGVVSRAIGELENNGHFGPFATVLGQALFLIAQTPDPPSLVLPQDRIIPFLGGGPLLRSSTLDTNTGVVVALGGTPVELVVATDLSLQFLQVSQHPRYVFRVREKLALRVKENDATIGLYVPRPIIDNVNPNQAPIAGVNVVITGHNLLGVTEIHFGDVVVPIAPSIDDARINVAAPRHPAGEAVVRVIRPVGFNSDPVPFTYR